MTALTTALEHRQANRGRAERRTLSDRRDRPTPLFSGHALLGGRRRVARRRVEQAGAAVDAHGTLLFGVVTGIVLLNLLDAFFTMLFLSYGGIEANPIVDWVLRSGGVWPFLVFKSIGIGLCVGFLTLTKNHAISRIGLGIVAFGYTVLLGWHLYLYGNLPA